MAQVKTKNFEGLLPADQETLESWYISFWPAGSGPLNMMRYICAALEEIAEHRGYNIDFVQLKADALGGKRRD